jgi:hypothetical protein
MRRFIVSGLLLGSLWLLQATAADRDEAAANRHAMVGMRNNTFRPVEYWFRWGDGEWLHFTIYPGEQRCHSWAFALANQSTWPSPVIRFDQDARGVHPEWVTRELSASPAPAADYRSGNRYPFSRDLGDSRIFLRGVADDPIRASE